MRMHNPPHPGKVLREFLGGVDVTTAARHLKVSRATLSTSSTARLASRPKCRCVFLLRLAPTLPSGMSCRPITIFGAHRERNCRRLNHSIALLRNEDRQTRNTRIMGQSANVHSGAAVVAIDNALEKIRNIADEDDSQLLGSLIQAGGLFSPVFAVLAALKGVIDISEVKVRIWTAIRSLCDELEKARDRWPVDAESALKNSVWFKKAVQVLIEESLRAPNEERAVLLAKAAAHGCFPSHENMHRQEDLASYIRDLALLGEDDIQMLKLLRMLTRTCSRTIRICVIQIDSRSTTIPSNSRRINCISILTTALP